MNSKLAEFLAAEAARDWDARTHNCGLWLADWLVIALGIADPAAQLRADCARNGMNAFTRFAPLRETVAICARLGLPRTDDPLTGDIAVVAVRMPGARHITGAIMGRRGWIVPAMPSRGLSRPAPQTVRCLAAWRIDECHT